MPIRLRVYTVLIMKVGMPIKDWEYVRYLLFEWDL